MQTVEELDALSPEQCRSIKAKAADIQALNNRLLYDLTRLKIFPAASNFYDLVYNYNTEVHSITYMRLQRANIPKNTIRCSFTTLQNIEHSVITAFGDSENTYGGDKWAILLNPPPQVLGKGNVDDPYIWETVSTPLLECLQDSVHGSMLKCCISQDSLKLVVY